jgi:hypothetical protein
MNLTEHEQKLLLWALDKATVDVEAEKAAQALIISLRHRGINGYEFLGEIKATYTDPTPPPKPTPRPQPTSAKTGWKDGPVASRESRKDLFFVIAVQRSHPPESFLSRESTAAYPALGCRARNFGQLLMSVRRKHPFTQASRCKVPDSYVCSVDS